MKQISSPTTSARWTDCCSDRPLRLALPPTHGLRRLNSARSIPCIHSATVHPHLWWSRFRRLFVAFAPTPPLTPFTPRRASRRETPPSATEQ